MLRIDRIEKNVVFPYCHGDFFVIIYGTIIDLHKKTSFLMRRIDLWVISSARAVN